VADKLKQALVNAHPNLEVAGTLCPPFRELTPDEDQADIDAINMARPDIIWVGLSTPKQEFWMGGISDASRPRSWSASGLRSTSWQERNVRRPSGCSEMGLSGFFGCARSRVACGAAMPTSFPAF